MKTLKSSQLFVVGSAMLCASLNARADNQSSGVTLYGILDTFVEHVSNTGSGSAFRMASGGWSASRWGMRGTEAVGGGYTVQFQLESGMDTTTGALQGNLFGRQSWVGIAAPWGQIRLGRQYVPSFWIGYSSDAWGFGTVGTVANVLYRVNPAQLVTRANNAITYLSPDFYGFAGQVQYAPGGSPGAPAANSTYGANLTYTWQGLWAGAAFQHANSTPSGIVGVPSSNTNTYNVGASYQFPILTAYAGFTLNQIPNTQYAYTIIDAGVKVPTGPAGSVISEAIFVHDRSHANQGTSIVSLGYVYFLSKRTNIYAVGAKAFNRNGAKWALGSAADTGVPVKGNGAPLAFQLGISHSF